MKFLSRVCTWFKARWHEAIEEPKTEEDLWWWSIK